MMTLGIVWLACAGIVIDALHRAPGLEWHP